MFRNTDNDEISDKIIKIVTIVAAIAAVLLICFFVYNEYFSDNKKINENEYNVYMQTEESAKETSITDINFTEINTSIFSNAEITTTASSSETTEITSDASDFPPDYNVYSKEFYDNILLIGDSIFGGFSAYEFLPYKNVFYKVGLNPDSILTQKITDMWDKKEKTAVEKATEFNADYICIMLGTNGMNFLELDYMTKKMGLFIDELKTAVPNSKIVILSVLPITKEYENDKKHSITLEKILEYNTMLKSLAEDYDCFYVDVYSMLSDESGYYYADYAEADGLHCTGNAYHVILHTIEEALKGNSEPITTESAVSAFEAIQTGNTVSEVIPSYENIPQTTSVIY